MNIFKILFMEFNVIISLEERIVTLSILLLGAFLPFCFVAGIIISALGVADNANKVYIYTQDVTPIYQIYLMCATMLLIISILGCVCFSCTILYKLREHSWEKRRHFDRINLRSGVESISESTSLIQIYTPPPIYSSLLKDP